MALIDGDFANIGDIFVLELEPIKKAVSFNFFQDSVSGDTVERFFTKEFRYTTDLNTYSPWTVLTDNNLQSISIEPLVSYVFEFRYTRAGNSTDGLLKWNYFYLDATVEEAATETYYPAIFSNNNLFGEFEIDDVNITELCSNLSNKMIKYGIIPLYISDSDKERTEDYVQFWEAASCFFALHFVLAKQLSDMFIEKKILSEYLTQRGAFLCGEETLEELQDVSKNFFNIIKKRGTLESITEIKRLLCVDENQEFILGYCRPHELGWTMGYSSPIYQGADGILDLNKVPRVEQGSVFSKENYNLINSNEIAILATQDNDGDDINVLHIDNVSAETGIKQLGTNFELSFTVDSSVNYEISFLVKQEVLGSILSFGILAWNDAGELVPNPTESILDGGDESFFFRMSDAIKVDDIFYKVVGLIYNDTEPTKSAQDSKTNLGVGDNLRWKDDASFSKIYPIITVENGGSVANNSTMIYDLRVAIASNEYSIGLLDTAGLVIAYWYVNSGNHTFKESSVIIDKYLISVNSTIKIKKLPLTLNGALGLNVGEDEIFN